MTPAFEVSSVKLELNKSGKVDGGINSLSDRFYTPTLICPDNERDRSCLTNWL